MSNIFRRKKNEQPPVRNRNSNSEPWANIFDDLGLLYTFKKNTQHTNESPVIMDDVLRLSDKTSLQVYFHHRPEGVSYFHLNLQTTYKGFDGQYGRILQTDKGGYSRWVPNPAQERKAMKHLLAFFHANHRKDKPTIRNHAPKPTPTIYALLANPKIYDIESASTHLSTDTWTIRIGKVSPGDFLVFWRTLDVDGQRGVVALGQVLESPKPRSSPTEAAQFFQDQDNVNSRRPIRRVLFTYIKAPNLPLWLADDTTGLLQSLTVSRGQGSKLYKVTDAQWEKICNLVGWAPPVPQEQASQHTSQQAQIKPTQRAFHTHRLSTASSQTVGVSSTSTDEATSQQKMMDSVSPKTSLPRQSATTSSNEQKPQTIVPQQSQASSNLGGATHQHQSNASQTEHANQISDLGIKSSVHQVENDLYQSLKESGVSVHPQHRIPGSDFRVDLFIANRPSSVIEIRYCHDSEKPAFQGISRLFEYAGCFPESQQVNFFYVVIGTLQSKKRLESRLERLPRTHLIHMLEDDFKAKHLAQKIIDLRSSFNFSQTLGQRLAGVTRTDKSTQLQTLHEPHTHSPQSTVSNTDHRLTGSVSRYQLPSPLSGLYAKYKGQTDKALRYSFALLLADGIFRFMAIVMAADAIANGICETKNGQKKVREWLKKVFASPGMGKQLHVAKDARKYLISQGKEPFVPEMASLLSSEEWSTIDIPIVLERNEYAHVRLGLHPEQASIRLQSIEPQLQQLLTSIQFLKNYRFGCFVHQKRHRHRNKGWQMEWRSSVGCDEDSEGIMVSAERRVPFRCKEPGNDILLVSPKYTKSLSLSPLFIRSAFHGVPQYYWLDKVHPEHEIDDWSKQVQYRHPVRNELTMHNAIHDQYADSLPWDDYVQSPATWHKIQNLGLDAESLQILRSSHLPVSMSTNYIMLRRLGAGGMGDVYEVFNQKMGIKRALKLLKQELLNSPTQLARFKREGQTLAKLKHPGVVQVYDMDVLNGQPYIDMELLPGSTLKDQIVERGSFSWQDTVQLIRQLLDILVHIHRNKVLHRDLKPSNIMLHQGHLTLFDFGIAKDHESGQLTRTHTLSVMGTEYYMAPEQWDNKATERSDIYSCGLILASLLGRSPTMPNMPKKIDNLTIPQWLITIYKKATHLEEDERFQSAKSMLETLETHLQS